MPNRKLWGMAATLLAVGATYAFAQSRKTAPLPAEFAALKTCEVHGDELQLGTAVILYGDRPPVVRDFAAQRQFPRAYSYIMGGCVVSRDSPTSVQVKFCPHCREAQAKWLADHHTFIPSS